MAQAKGARYRCCSLCIPECNHPVLGGRLISVLPGPKVMSLLLVTLDRFLFHKFACETHPSYNIFIYLVYVPSSTFCVARILSRHQI